MIESILRTEADLTKSDYRLAPDVIFLRVKDGSARLLDLGGNFYTISETAAQMLNETLKAGTTTAAERIATEYCADLSLIQHDLKTFLQDLEEKQLIYPARRPRSTSQSKNTLAQLVCMPVLHCVSVCSLSLEKKAWALLTLAALAIRLFGWPKTVASWQHYAARRQSHNSTQKQAQGAIPMENAMTELEQSAKEIDKVVRAAAARHLLHAECKERALACWWLLHAAGFPAQLVVGVELFPLASHCWCTMGNFVLSDDQDRCEQFTPVISYD